ncbi:putative ribosomal protein S14 [Helianthus anomalus]
MDTNRNLTSMAKKSLIQREKKRQKLEQKYHLIRRSSKEEISKVRSLSDKWEIYGKLQSPPRNSAPTRLHRRCFSTGRPRANYRDFGQRAIPSMNKSFPENSGDIFLCQQSKQDYPSHSRSLHSRVSLSFCVTWIFLVSQRLRI